MRKDFRRKVFENRVPRKIPGPKEDQETGEWSKLLSEELSDLYCSPSVIWVITRRRIRCTVHVARVGERRDTYRLLVGKSEGGRRLVRRKRRLKDNIKVGLKEVRWEHGLDWSGSEQGQVVSSFECGNEPSGSVKCGEFIDRLGNC